MLLEILQAELHNEQHFRVVNRRCSKRFQLGEFAVFVVLRCVPLVARVIFPIDPIYMI